MKYQLLVGAVFLAGVAAPAQAEAGDVLVRLRAVMVSPTESSSGVRPSFPNDHVSVTDSFAPEIDLTYFATDHVAFELIAATTKHAVEGRGGLKPLGELVDTWVLPPTLTAQYHFAPAATVRPYVGAGINYTLFYNEDASGALETAIGSTRVKLDNSVGYALQAGVDIDLNDCVFLNLDVKYIDIDTKATLTTDALRNEVDVSINPIVAGIGLGMRF